MNRSLANLGNCAFLAATVFLAAPASGGVIYDNLTTNTISHFYGRFDPGTKEVGNEIVNNGLTVADRLFSLFTIEYWATNLSGGALSSSSISVTLRIYDQTGAGYGNATPGNLLGVATNYITSQTGLGLNTLNFRLGPQFGLINTLTNVGEDYTFTVQFGSLGSGDHAGLTFHNPPDTSYAYAQENWNDMWVKDSGNWVNVSSNAQNSFGARIEAVPEPATVWLLALAGLAGLGFVRRSKSAK